MQQVCLTIQGRVQRVFYRAEAQKKALELGLKGFAKNNADGTVTIIAQGAEERLKLFIQWCWDGSKLAHVENIDIRYEEDPAEQYSDFSIS